MLDIASPLEMALAYADHGWAVLPLHTVVAGVCDCRRECGSPGKHPRTMAGFKDASTDRVTVARWWGWWPIANVGIATGDVSGLMVIDIDPRNGGDASVRKLIDRGFVFPDTAEVTTQGGGSHLYYRYAGKVKRSMGAGIDVQADGKYVVAPPSRGKDGAYVWRRAMEPAAL